MGTTATGARKLQLTINVPQPMTLRYLDVYPDSGQGYGPSLKAKGTVDGEDVILYVPGKLWAALKALKAAGVIADGQYDEEPTERYNIPVLVPEIVITREQKPGAKYAEIVVQAAGAAKPAPKANGKEGRYACLTCRTADTCPHARAAEEFDRESSTTAPAAA